MIEETIDQLEAAIRDKNEQNLINIVQDNSQTKLLQLREDYKTKFKRDLLEDLKKADFNENFHNAITGIFKNPVEYDAFLLNKAMKGIGSNKNIMTEIICFRDKERINAVKDKYQEMYGKDLLAELKDESSGVYQKIMLGVLEGNRNVNANPDLEQCSKIAEELYKAGEGKFGTNEEVFINYFTTLSPEELLLVCKEYHKKYGRTMVEALKAEFSGAVKDILRAILYSMFSPCEYFAKQIMESIKGAGTDNDKLIRIIITRYSIDMKLLKKYFKRMYNKDLLTEIKDDVSGSYGKLLEALINKQN